MAGVDGKRNAEFCIVKSMTLSRPGLAINQRLAL